MTKQEAFSAEKQSYESPVLVTHGNVQELTLGNAANVAADTGTST